MSAFKAQLQSGIRTLTILKQLKIKGKEKVQTQHYIKLILRATGRNLIHDTIEALD